MRPAPGAMLSRRELVHLRTERSPRFVLARLGLRAHLELVGTTERAPWPGSSPCAAPAGARPDATSGHQRTSATLSANATTKREIAPAISVTSAASTSRTRRERNIGRADWPGTPASIRQNRDGGDQPNCEQQRPPTTRYPGASPTRPTVRPTMRGHQDLERSRSSMRLPAGAHTPHGDQTDRVGGVGLDLLAQSADVDCHIDCSPKSILSSPAAGPL